MTEPTFFFYDLETSGLDPKHQRIMQFAGIRTTMDLQPVGEPYNWIVALTDEVLPDPPAIVVTGITPQFTVREGMSEADFARKLASEITTPGTTMVGFNNVRFDDEYLRYTFYRNFIDPYEWAWKDGRSRWDMLDVVRMVRALRPDGLKWGTGADGAPISTLVSLSEANGLEHIKAHDALSDVEALIAVTRLVRDKQPKMFDFLLAARDKRRVSDIIKPYAPEPFVYTSGMYGKARHFTTIGVVIGDCAGRSGSHIVYDLSVDPAPFAGLSVDELHERLFMKREEREASSVERPPVKELHTNKCPAVAPLSTWTPEVEARLALTRESALQTYRKLQASGLIPKLVEASNRKRAFEPALDVDGALYDGFFGDGDKAQLARVSAARSAEALKALKISFSDERLPALLTHYKARNYPEALSDTDAAEWDDYRRARIQSDLPAFAEMLQKAALTGDPAVMSLLQDVQLWAESIIPGD